MHDHLARWLSELPAALPRLPEAVVVVTAHWEAPQFTVAGGDQPGLIYDYGGFPPHTYQVTYPAPGHPGLATRLAELARSAGIECRVDPSYGWDHGVFVPLAVSWPEAEVPVVAVSLRAGLDPADHVAFGRAISPLRSEDVLILGSGLSTHDLTFRVSPTVARAFDRWLDETLALPGPARAEQLARWASAPGGRACHPREEHLLPLMVVVGAGGDEPARRTYHHDLFDLPAAGFTLG